MYLKTTFKTNNVFKYKQTTIDDFLLDTIFNNKPIEIEKDESDVKQFSTFQVNYLPKYNTNIMNKAHLLNSKIKEFIRTHRIDEMYREFKIPKRKGGFRKLVDPEPELKELQRETLDFLQDTLNIIPHNAAHAFIKNRDCYTNAMTHKDNKCFITLDIENFFPSINQWILRKALLLLAETAAINYWIPEFNDNIIRLALYKGELPQGSPLSPFLSNIVMLKFDYELTLKMYKGEIPKFTYTRYADDMCLSAKAFPHIKTVLSQIEQLLYECFDGMINLKKSKTKILKNTNRCYITGVKINKDKQLTYGHENKKKLKLDLYNLFKGKINNTLTSEEVMETLGRYAYMSRIEPNYARYLQLKLLKDFSSNAQTIFKHFKEYLVV